ncbi:MAG: hypothetical protein R3338_04340 [Thermoanaerobaculia bacterium]|nr:hypothetical protein [Thermoanaerobaculia bacterium]
MRRVPIWVLSLFAVLLFVVPSPAWAQQEEAAQAEQVEATGDEDAVIQDLQGILEEESLDAYRYDPQGRRDPFRSLIGPARQDIDRGDAPPGLPGFLIDEIDLQGIVRTSQGYVATVKGPDNLGYTLRPGDVLYDGEVLRITADAVYFRQEVSDPTRIERQREVVKELERGSQATRP